MILPSDNFYLIETMRCDGEIHLLERHLARLEKSADIFAIEFRRDEIVQTIERAATRLDSDRPFRIRLTLNTHGRPGVSASPVEPFGEPKIVALAELSVDSADPFLYHKTSRRERYDADYREARSLGLFEFLYVNERGEVTEGSRTNVFVRTGDEWLTPPVSCGLLPGVYRSHVLETESMAREVTLSPADLIVADRIFLCNAVIGLTEVRLLDSADPQITHRQPDE